MGGGGGREATQPGKPSPLPLPIRSDRPSQQEDTDTSNLAKVVKDTLGL